MASETITRNDLTAILNEVLPSTAVDYYETHGTKSVASGAITNLASYTLPSTGVWLVVSSLMVTASGSSSASIQNRMQDDNHQLRAVRGAADTTISTESIMIRTSGTIELNTYHNVGSARDIYYQLQVAKLR